MKGPSLNISAPKKGELIITDEINYTVQVLEPEGG